MDSSAAFSILASMPGPVEQPPVASLAPVHAAPARPGSERPAASAQPPGQILVVDDEPAVTRVLARVLSRAGHKVHAVTDARSAVHALASGGFDLVISDVSMPDMDGTELLRMAHERDPDLPVVLLSGVLSLDVAMRAVEHHAFRYLGKPIDTAALVQVASAALSARRDAVELREEFVRSRAPDADRAELSAALDDALTQLWMAFQPIARRGGEIYGYEALLRSDSKRLRGPLEILGAADRLGRLTELGRRVRARAAADFAAAPPETVLFLNLVPGDLLDPTLLAPEGPLAAMAGRVVLEVTEQRPLAEIPELPALVEKLRGFGFRLAVDDLGAGYAGLSSFAMLAPEVAKVDMSLVRDIDTITVKQRLVRAMVEVCRDMGVPLLAEGIETRGELAVLCDLGVELFQGYLLGRPARTLARPVWPAE